MGQSESFPQECPLGNRVFQLGFDRVTGRFPPFSAAFVSVVTELGSSRLAQYFYLDRARAEVPNFIAALDLDGVS